jgi:predicted RND superfamily exporter protein/outer membrane lipoprotein-sorting protein
MRAYIEFIVRYRWMVLVFVLIATVFLHLRGQTLTVIIDPNNIVPRSHPFVSTTLKVEEVFGSRYVGVIGITPKDGDVFNPNVLAKVQRITAKLRETPRVVKANLLSVSARRAKDIRGNDDGMEVRQMMPDVPTRPEEMAALKDALQRNTAYMNSVISTDFKTITVLAEVRDATPAELKEGKGGFSFVNKKITDIVDAERDDSVDITVTGYPAFLALLEQYSSRGGVLLLIALGVIGVVHYEAFRTLQGLILPLVTPLVAVTWGKGFMGLAGVPLDIFNMSTPILILAVGAGHAVQMLKRYYEEYNVLRQDSLLSAREANHRAVIESIVKIGPVMLVAGLVAAAGFLSLMIFDIVSIRVFGVFAGIGVLSVLFIEMTFIPALRAILPPPGEKEARMEREERVWDRITSFYADTMLGQRRRYIFIITGVIIAVSAVGMTQLRIESALKKYFDPDLPLLVADRKLNERMAGTNNVYLMIEGDKPDAIKDPAVLRAMDELQTFVSNQPNIGKVISISEFIKRMNQSMNADNPEFFRIPDKQETIAEYLLLYSMSGEPGDFDPYVDYDYRLANMVVFTHSDSTIDLHLLWRDVQEFVAKKFPPNVKVNLGGSVAQSAAITDVIVKDKILNVIQIASVVFIAAALVFRSLVAGLLVISPLLLSVLVNMGLMGLLGMRLNVPTALTSALAIGIGADYAIYMLFRLREEIAKGTDVDSAFRKVLKTAGKACLFVASAVAAGYAVQAGSRGYYPHTWNAILIGTAMLVSVTAALTVMPALVLKFRPKFIFGENNMNDSGNSAKPLGATVAAVVVGVLLSMSIPRDALAVSAVEIMEKNFVVGKYADSTAETTMTLTNKSGQQRIRKTFGTTKLEPNGLDNKRMTRFLEPADVKGTVSLLVEHSEKDDDIWIYLPSVKKVRRLISSNKKDSFVGTDFSYGDVIGHKVKEWNHNIVKEEDADGKSCYVIESSPKDATIKANTGYSKRITWIQKDNFVTIKSAFYDEAGELLKEARYSHYKEVDPVKKKWQAGVLEARNVQTGHSTNITIDNFKVNVGVKDDYFTTRYMEQQ